jgi:fatty-acyl-CoA synthase
VRPRLTPLRCLERATTVFPKKIGVVCGEQQFTFEQLGQRCERLAAALKALATQKGDRVAYLSFNTHKLWEGYFGVPQAGAILMPLNVRLSMVELAGILAHAEPCILFYEHDFAPAVQQLRANCRSIRHFVALDDATEEQLHYEALLKDCEPASLDLSVSGDEDLAELFYTSGSMGTPKGVGLSHRALYFHALAVAGIRVDPRTAVDLCTIPLFHANGWGHAHASTMLGIKQVMVRRFDPVAVLQLIEQQKATDMSIVPLMGNALISVPHAERFDVSSMRQISIGGAASSPALVERLENLFG